MATETRQFEIEQKISGSDTIKIHPETDAEIVNYDNTTSGLTADDVQAAIDELATRPAGGVTGVKGDSESTYRAGNVNITKANIGLGNVTNDKQVKGNASGTTAGHIVTWGSDGYTVADGGKSVQDIVDIAEGKTTAYVTNVTQMANLSTDEANVIVTAFKDKDGNTVALSNFKIGDMVYLTDNDYPDRWVSAKTANNMTLTATEGKIDLTNYIQKSSTSGLVKNDGTIDTTILGRVSDLEDKFTGDKAKDADKLDGQDGSYYYHKDTNGIPKADLASGVQGSLDKADSALQSLTATGDVTGTATKSAGAGSINLTLANSGVTAGTYSAVAVNAKGIVTDGGQVVEVGTTINADPSSALVNGGIFFRRIA